MHSSICETYLLYCFSIDLCSDWRREVVSVCHGYMCILLYVKIICCSGFPEIYARLEEKGVGQSAIGICAFFYM